MTPNEADVELFPDDVSSNAALRTPASVCFWKTLPTSRCRK